MKRTTIELHPKGIIVSQKASDIYNSLEKLRDKENFDIHKYEYQFLSGIETLLITIAGTLGGNILSLIFEKLFLDQKPSEKHEQIIEIKHLDSNKSFYLPEQEIKCIEFFRKLDSSEDKGGNDANK